MRFVEPDVIEQRLMAARASLPDAFADDDWSLLCRLLARQTYEGGRPEAIYGGIVRAFQTVRGHSLSSVSIVTLRVLIDCLVIRGSARTDVLRRLENEVL